MKLTEQIQNLVANARTEDALNLLAKHHSDASILLEQFHSSKRQNNLGLMDNAEWFRVNARINNSVLELADRVSSENKEKKTIVVHDGVFHPDEVLADAIIRHYNKNFAFETRRSRKPEDLESADFRVDVGMRYDPAKGDFDHHQDVNLPASCNLVFNHFATESEMVKNIVKKKLLDPISGLDCNFSKFSQENPVGIYYTIGQAILAFNRVEMGTEVQLKQYNAAVQFAAEVFKNCLYEAENTCRIYDIISRGVVIAEFATVYEQGFSYNDYRDFVRNLIVIPQPDSTWAVVSLDTQQFNLVNGEKLYGAIFAHPAGFFAKFLTREKAEEFAKLKSKERSQEIDSWQREHCNF